MKMFEQLYDITDKIKEILLKNDINCKPLDNALSCLSCLNLLDQPLTLNCGHSICKKCFEQHSDPKSKESIVFCEDCKMETKNKSLKELKTIKNKQEMMGKRKLKDLQDLAPTMKEEQGNSSQRKQPTS